MGKLQQVTCLFLGRLRLQSLHRSSPAPAALSQMQREHGTVTATFSRSHHDWHLVARFKVRAVKSNLVLANTCFATLLFDMSDQNVCVSSCLSALDFLSLVLIQF